MNYCYFPYFDPYNPKPQDASQTPGDLLIRVAHTEDINELAEVLTHSFHPPKGFNAWFYPLLKLGISEDLRSKVRVKNLHEVCLVASKSVVKGKKEQIVGTVELSVRSPYLWCNSGIRQLYICNLAVSHSHRRQGIAKKLLFKCEQIALEWGFKELFLHVLENNRQAKKLYFSHGYKVQRIESSLNSFFWKSPRRLFLNKQLCAKIT